MPIADGPAEEHLARARTLQSDVATVEVAAALQEADVPVILLKGPAVASWLYPDEERLYADSDLLVRRDRHHIAQRVLRELGFFPIDEGLEPPERGLLHSQPWVRPDDLAEIDLHMTLFGMGVSPEQTWAELAGRTRPLEVAGVEMQSLDPAGRALQVAVHALQHEDMEGKPLEDLARALDRLPIETWAEAVQLADRLDATSPFVLGLSRLPAGEQLCARLGVFAPELAREASTRGSAAALAVGFERLARARGVRGKTTVLAREVAPTPEFIRWWSPMARRGRLGMVLAYLWRPLWLLVHAAPSLAAWRRHRRQPGRA